MLPLFVEPFSVVPAAAAALIDNTRAVSQRTM